MPFGAGAHAARHGFEMNNGSVITHRAKGAKPPSAASTPTLVFGARPHQTYTLPPQQLANGVVDAFVHTVEQYLTYPVNAPGADRGCRRHPAIR